MKKFIFLVILVAVLLTGCQGDSYVDGYPPPETYDEYELNGPGQPESSYEEPPDTPDYPDEYEYLYEHPAEAFARPQNAVAISAASEHTLALMEDGSLWSWGAPIGVYSIIGDGTAEARTRPVKIMENVTFAVAGQTHSFAITEGGVLWAWGANRDGALGDGTTELRLWPVKIMDNVVYATMLRDVPNSHMGPGVQSYAIRSDGSLWAWGCGDASAAYWDFALGDGGTESRYSPVQILENVRTVKPTHNGGFAITNDDTLWHWRGGIWVGSRDENGQWISIEFERKPYPVPIMENVASISAGFVITTNNELWQITNDGPVWIMNDIAYATGFNGTNFAITTDGTLLGWGRNLLPSHWMVRPVLGDGTTVDRDTPVVILENIVMVRIMGNNTYALAKDGNLWTWGTGMLSNLPHGPLVEYDYHEEEGWTLGKRWLADDDGGTGIRLYPVQILEDVIYVAPIYSMLNHGWVEAPRAFAITNCGSVWAWGVNDRFNWGLSLLGDGTSEDRPYPVRIIEGR